MLLTIYLPGRFVLNPLSIDTMVNLDSFQMAKIKWPSRLLEDAGNDPDFREPSVEALYNDTYPRVFEITSGQRTSPVMDDFQAALSQTPTRDLNRRALDFPANFSFPTLLGDEALVLPVLTRLLGDLKGYQKHHPEALYLRSPDLLTHGLAPVLFNIALIRHYLGRSSQDDMTIYSLIKLGSQKSNLASSPRIVRFLTEPESALATIIQWNDEDRQSRSAPRLLTTEVAIGKMVVHSASFKCSYREPLAYVATSDGEDFVWPPPIDSGLSSSGSEAQPMEDVPNSHGLPVEKVAPKPRPMYKKRKREEGNSMSEEDKVDSEDVQPSRGSGNAHGGVLAPALRRSTRSKTVVKRGLA